MLYNEDEMVGTQCTYYDHTTTATDGTAEVVWSSTTAIDYVESTNNVPKGYSFVGLTQNLETTISEIGSIPAIYDWTRTNTSTFKGNVCFDFMTNDVKGDSTSSSSHELMLWLEYEGGQLPIGWGNGVSATVDSLFGTSWKLYEGVNEDTGITVSSLLPDKQFDGSFSYDLKDWLEAMVTLGKFKDSTYVNVGNAGTEFFYGDATLDATLALQINLGSTDATTSSAVVDSVASTSASPLSISTASSTSVTTSSSAANLVTPTPAASSSTSTSSPTALAATSTKAVPASSAVTLPSSSATSPTTPEITSVAATSISAPSAAEPSETTAAAGADGEEDGDTCEA